MSEYEVGEIPPEQQGKQNRRLEDFVKGRMSGETLGRIASNADKLQQDGDMAANKSGGEGEAC